MTKNSTPSQPSSSTQHRKRASNDEKWATLLEKLKNLFHTIEFNQPPTVIDQYAARLCDLLSKIRSRGGSAERVCKQMNNALTKNDIGTYINDACELAAASHFLKLYPENFLYQVPIESGNHGIPKTFDFSFSTNGFKFNVEVKSFTPEPPERPRRLFKSFLPPSQTHELVNQGAEFEANCMPALIRSMTKATSQLPHSDDAHNVMLLCCNNPDEVVDVLTCLIGPHGLCRRHHSEDPLRNLSAFPNIDTVVICQLGLQHLCFLEPGRRSEFFPNDSTDMNGGQAWEYSNALSASVNLRQIKISEAETIALAKAFNLHDAFFYPRINNNGENIQEVWFNVFNTYAPSLTKNYQNQ